MSEIDATLVKDGQKVVATVSQSGTIISDPSAVDATALVQTDDGPQLCVKTFEMGEGGGGGGGTVDQTYDATSTNAQSGTAVAQAVAPYLKNVATGTNSLSILADPATSSDCVGIGVGAKTTSSYGTAVGRRTYAQQGATSVGYKISSGQISVCIGAQAYAQNAIGAIAIGGALSETNNTRATEKRAIAIGSYGYDTNLYVQANAQDAIQLGCGINSTAKTFQVYEYQLLDGTTGKIPVERLPIANANLPVGASFQASNGISFTKIANNPPITNFNRTGTVNISSDGVASEFDSSSRIEDFNTHLIPNNFSKARINFSFTMPTDSLTHDVPIFSMGDALRTLFIEYNSRLFSQFDGSTATFGNTSLELGETYEGYYDWNGSTATAYIYINGTPVKQFETNTTFLVNAQRLCIGGKYNYNYFFPGTVNLAKTSVIVDDWWVWQPFIISEAIAISVDVPTAVSSLSGYDATKTQVLKNVNGTLTWVNE